MRTKEQKFLSDLNDEVFELVLKRLKENGYRDVEYVSLYADGLYESINAGKLMCINDVHAEMKMEDGTSHEIM